jgi:hypothetical protein
LTKKGIGGFAAVSNKKIRLVINCSQGDCAIEKNEEVDCSVAPAAPPAAGVAGGCDPNRGRSVWSQTKGGWGYIECNANHTMKAAYLCNATGQYQENVVGSIGLCKILCGAESFCNNLRPGELRCDANCQVSAAAAAGGTSGLAGTVSLVGGGI